MILAIDTSTEVCVVGLCDSGGTPLWVHAEPGEGRHGDVLLPRIAEGLAALGAEATKISVLAVGAGPGSFTGLRIGLATAQGFALSFAVRACAVVSSEAIAIPLLAARGGRVAVLTDAFKGEVALAVYGPAAPDAPVALTPEAAAARIAALCGPSPVTVVGSGLRRYHARILPSLPAGCTVAPDTADIPSPEALAAAALDQLASGASGDPQALVPYYVRDADAKLPDRPLKL